MASDVAQGSKIEYRCSSAGVQWRVEAVSREASFSACSLARVGSSSGNIQCGVRPWLSQPFGPLCRRCRSAVGEGDIWTLFSRPHSSGCDGFPSGGRPARDEQAAAVKRPLALTALVKRALAVPSCSLAQRAGRQRRPLPEQPSSDCPPWQAVAVPCSPMSAAKDQLEPLQGQRGRA